MFWASPWHFKNNFRKCIFISFFLVFNAAIFVRTNTRHFEASNKQANYRSQQFYREIIIDISHFEIIQNRLELGNGYCDKDKFDEVSLEGGEGEVPR